MIFPYHQVVHIILFHFLSFFCLKLKKSIFIIYIDFFFAKSRHNQSFLTYANTKLITTHKIATHTMNAITVQNVQDNIDVVVAIQSSNISLTAQVIVDACDTQVIK